MSEIARETGGKALKKRGGPTTGSVTSSKSDPNLMKPKKAGSVSTMSFADERSHDVQMRAHVNYENTYQMAPSQKFHAGQVESIIQQLLKEYLGHEQYKAELCRQMSKSLSEVIRARVKELFVPRYKMVCIVHIGQIGDQCMRIGSRCLWDPTSDTFATCEFKNSSLFAVCTVYGVYCE